MGGGGGGFGNSGTASAVQIERQVAEATGISEYEAKANSYLQDLLSSFNARNTEATRRHIDTLRDALERDVDGQLATQFGGSVSKHTHVDGLSDADVLVLVDSSSLAENSPEAVLSYFEERIKARLPSVTVKAGKLAVTVSYSDGIELQLLPALRTPTGVRIANPDGVGWSNVVRPQAFAQKLTAVNQSCGRKVVPTIKLFKGLQAQLPERNRVTGYHAESLAIEAFETYSGRQSYKDMLHHMIDHASRRVLSPITEATGQSLHVDDYLGATSSPDRVRVSKSLERLAKRMSNANDRASIDDLMRIFGDG